jgi:CHAD domain-containing protein
VWLRHTTEELRWIGTVLGQVRDADVLAGHFSDRRDPATATGDGTTARMQRLDAERSRGVREVSTALASDRYIDLLDKLHAAIEAAPFVRGAAIQPDAGVWESDSRSSAALPAFVPERWRN